MQQVCEVSRVVLVQLGLPAGSIKATVLIENVLAAFEMDEILFELREHSAGLNCGIWDYSASFVNKFGEKLTGSRRLQNLVEVQQNLLISDFQIFKIEKYTSI